MRDETKSKAQKPRAGTVILGIAVGAYLVGGFFAFFAADLLL